MDLGKYLGLPLLHKVPTRATYDFILDRTQRRLSAWKASTLSLAGRITLAKSVIAALPSYCMQTMLLPKGICEKLDQLQRNFIWGSENGTRKVSQVSWETICSPKSQGGPWISSHCGLQQRHDHENRLGFDSSTHLSLGSCFTE